MIVDVRGNTGGSTPQGLLARLMNRRFRWWTESVALSAGLLKFRGVLGEHSDLFSYGGPSDPEKDAYQGELYLLVDEVCGSADVEVHTTVEDLRVGSDPVLTKAYALIREHDGQKSH